MPFGGNFRIIDFTLSNCINSGIRRIGVLTQYKAYSLIRHVQRGWGFLRGEFDEFVELLPPQQWLGPQWYAGTADAVFQNLDIVKRHAPEFVLILAGDHIYKMDYGPMIARHMENAADMTVGCVAVPAERAGEFGVMSVDNDGRVTAFAEKPEIPCDNPQRPDTVARVDGNLRFQHGLSGRTTHEGCARSGVRSRLRQEPDSRPDCGIPRACLSVHRRRRRG